MYSLPTAIIWVVAAVFLASYLYTPMPDNARHPVKQIFSRAMVRLMYDVARVGSGIGLGSEVNITRRLAELNNYLSLEPDDGTLEIKDKLFDGVKVRVYTPKALTGSRSAGLVNIHGGGWAYLDVDAYDAFCRRVAKHANLVVVSVEYRRAPEVTYPVPLDDCVKAVKYFMKNAKDFKVDPDRIGLTGDSAGGNLAIATALRLSKETDRNLPKLKLLSLMYPVLQAFDLQLPSYQEHVGRRSSSFCTKTTLIHCMQLYAFGKEPIANNLWDNTHISTKDRAKYSKYINIEMLPANLRKYPTEKSAEASKIDIKTDVFLDPHFSPLLASDEDLRKLPRTYLMTTEIDALRDEGLIFAKRMKDLDHPFDHDHMDGLEHGFVLFFYYDSALEYINNYSTYLNRHL